MNDPYLVETPEIVGLTYDVAGLGSRCLAALIDSLLLLLIEGGLGLALFTIIGEAAPAAADSLVLAAWALLASAILWGYYLAFELAWSGQTPGKRALGLRTVREGGRPITAAASAVRNLVRIIDFLPLGYGVGALTMFADRRARRLGDLAAGTLVMREAAVISLDALSAGAAPALIPPRAPDAPPTPLLPDLDRITADGYELAEDFLRRRGGLPPATRARLAVELAAALRARLDQPDSGAPELFIEHVVREYRVHRAERERRRG